MLNHHKTYCLPFKKTGFCKYGDNCKYLHLREAIEDRGQCNWCKEREDILLGECGHAFCEECATTSCNCRVCGGCGMYSYRL